MQPYLDQFNTTIKDWQQLQQSALDQLKKIVTYLEEIQAPFLEATVSVKAIVEEVSVEEFDRYLARGCRKAVSRRGWNDAKIAAEAYKDLLQATKASDQFISALQKVLEKSLTELQIDTPIKKKWKLRGGKNVGERMISSAEVAFLMAMKVDNLSKEHRLLETVVNSISLSSRVAELKDQLVVLKLRPYDNEETTWMLQNVEEKVELS